MRTLPCVCARYRQAMFLSASRPPQVELATIINEYTGNTTPLDLRPARDWDRSGKRFASIEKAARELGFAAQVDIREGLRRTVEWTKANQELIKRSIAKHDKLMAQART